MQPYFDHAGILSRRRYRVERVRITLRGNTVPAVANPVIDRAMDPGDRDGQPAPSPLMYPKQVQVSVQTIPGAPFQDFVVPPTGPYHEGNGTDYIGSVTAYLTSDSNLVVAWCHGSSPGQPAHCEFAEFQIT